MWPNVLSYEERPVSCVMTSVRAFGLPVLLQFHAVLTPFHMVLSFVAV